MCECGRRTGDRIGLISQVHGCDETSVHGEFLSKEPLIAILPSRHRLARHRTVPPQDLACESFISKARVAPVLGSVIDDYTAKAGIALKQNYDAETLSGGMSLVASTGGFTLLPLYARNALIPSVVARPLRGEAPTIRLMMGYTSRTLLHCSRDFCIALMN
jgi:LysR family transcriptional regulator, hca operon transcriptional activator